MTTIQDLEFHPFSELNLIALSFLFIMMIVDLAVNHSTTTLQHARGIRGGMQERIAFILLAACGVGVLSGDWNGTFRKYAFF